MLNIFVSKLIITFIALSKKPDHPTNKHDLKQVWKQAVNKFWSSVAKPAEQFSHAIQIFPCLQTVRTMNF